MVILTSFPPPTEGIVRKQECTQAHVRGKCLGDGTLYIAERLAVRLGGVCKVHYRIRFSETAQNVYVWDWLSGR